MLGDGREWEGGIYKYWRKESGVGMNRGVGARLAQHGYVVWWFGMPLFGFLVRSACGRSEGGSVVYQEYEYEHPG